MKCAVYLADGFEPCEAMITVDILRRGGIETDTVALGDDLRVDSSQRIPVIADKLMRDTAFEDYDILILPGGKKGTENLGRCEALKAELLKRNEEGRLIAAICAAPSILGKLGILKGRNYTCHPDFAFDYGGSYQMELAVDDGNLITGRGMGATVEFALVILARLVDADKMKAVKYGMQYEHSFRDDVRI